MQHASYVSSSYKLVPVSLYGGMSDIWSRSQGHAQKKAFIHTHSYKYTIIYFYYFMC